MVHAHRCRFPLACKTHKVPNLFVLRSVLSRLRLHFPEQGPPFLPYHDVLPSLQILLTLPAQNFAAIAPALPSSSRRFSPCRWRLLFMAFSPRCHRVRAGTQGTRPRHCGAAPCPWYKEKQQAMKRKVATIINNMCQLVNDHSYVLCCPSLAASSLAWTVPRRR